MHKDIARIVYSVEFERALKRYKKDKNLFKQIEFQIEKVLREPDFGKPLRHALKNRRRLHVGSFVLVYEFHGNELRFLDLDHHDRVYKKR
ncbi:type II toxin-antitoxin system RelE/ParE family toxin [Candidatus Kaiserbacteria bacterium]|nr:type II toxin-antitoxin system RelE/ParE family toxin [Candidatus Kaiserbacteria bacterium]